MKSIIGQNKVIPVVNFKSIDEVDPLVETYLKNSISVIEVTLRSDVSVKCIRRIKDQFPEMIVGAGTVLNQDQVDELEDIDFMISPGFVKDLALYVKSKNISYMPGIQTASELMAAKNLGFEYLKFFPAEAAGGIKMLKSLAAPFRTVKFCPTGGVDQSNYKNYLALDSVDFVGGSFLADRNLIEKEQWDDIDRMCRQITDTI